MKKTKYIRFNENGIGARIGINRVPPGAGPLLINPDLKDVAQTPPELWRLTPQGVSADQGAQPSVPLKYRPYVIWASWFLLGALCATGGCLWLM